MIQGSPQSDLERRGGSGSGRLPGLDRLFQPLDLRPEKADALCEFRRGEVIEVLADLVRGLGLRLLRE